MKHDKNAIFLGWNLKKLGHFPDFGENIEKFEGNLGFVVPKALKKIAHGALNEAKLVFFGQKQSKFHL